MSLYKALLIDIIYSLQKGNQDHGKEESKQFHSNQQNLALNYGMPSSLIDTMFEILENEPIKFDPNLRSQKEFLHAKEQLHSLQNASEQEGFDPTITREEALQIENPIIRGIILEQQLIPKQNEPKYQILFIHLMFLSFPELRLNNSIMVKRKYILLKLFEQSTYSYQPVKQWYQSRITDEINNQIDDKQDHIAMKDQTLISQVIEDKLSQDLKNSQQFQSIFKEKQTDSKVQSELRQLRDQMDQKRYYFSSDYPIEIEKISSHQIKMTFSQVKQQVYTWSSLDLSSYFNLMTTNPKAYYCWTNMLKLLNQIQFSSFINDQLVDSESDDDKAINDNLYQQTIIDDHIQIDNIIRIDSLYSILKFSNKVMIIEQNKLEQIFQRKKEQMQIANNFIEKRNQINDQIRLMQQQFNINCSLEVWQDWQKRLERRSIWNYAFVEKTDSPQIAQSTDVQGQSIQVINPIANRDQIKQIDQEIQTLSLSELRDGEKMNTTDIADINQHICEDTNLGIAKDIRVNSPVVYIKGQHKGQWIFQKQYPLKIVHLTNQRLLFIMKRNRSVIVEWWQFNYESLQNLQGQKGTKQSAYFWIFMLILLDEDQFFQLWKGEVIQYSQNGNEQVQKSFQPQGFAEEQNAGQILNNSENDSPVTIIQYNYSFIIKFKNHVEIFTLLEFEELQSQSHNAEEWYIQKNKLFYKHKMIEFEERLLTEQKNNARQQVIGTEVSQKKALLSEANSNKTVWIFNDDYPIRVDIIDIGTLRLKFKNKTKTAVVKWQQFHYESLIKLIDQKINVKAGEAWSNMLILVDQDQFYKLWKSWQFQSQGNESTFSSDEQQGNYLSQAQIGNSKFIQLQAFKRDPPNQEPQMIVKLDSTRFIVKFEKFIEIQTNTQVAEYEEDWKITQSQFTKFKIKISRAFYREHIKAFQQRLKLEIQQAEQFN